MVHWIVVAFAILNDEPEPGFGHSTSLLQYLYLFNLPALYLAGLLWNLITFFVPGVVSENFLSTTLAATFVSLQWLLIGSSVGILIREINAADGVEEVNLETSTKMELNKK